MRRVVYSKTELSLYARMSSREVPAGRVRGRLSSRVKDNSRRVVARPSDEVEELDVLLSMGTANWADPISQFGETEGDERELRRW